MSITQGRYELLDSGGHRRLEQVGPYRLSRVAPHAHWERRLGRREWDKAVAIHHRLKSGGGRWEFQADLPASWWVEYEDRPFRIELTDFGHIGLFAEQAANWHRLAQWACGRPGARALNLFAYSGGSTLALAGAGAHVTHVDASRGVIGWGQENAAAAGLDSHPIRWLLDDVPKFVAREKRRQKRYDILVLDPPSFGRGNRGEVFKIDRDLIPLLKTLRDLLSDNPIGVQFSCHSPGYSPLVCQQILQDHFGTRFETIQSGEMTIPQTTGPWEFPTGVWVSLQP